MAWTGSEEGTEADGEGWAVTAVHSVSTESAPDAQRPGRVRRALLPIARVIFTAAVVVAVVWVTASQWIEVRTYISGLSWPLLLLSLLMVLVAAGATTLGWRAALAAVGHQVPVRTAAQIYLIGMLAKYLPGSVWAFVLQMELGKRANLPRSRPFLASVALTGVGVTAALTLGLFALPTLRDVSRPLAVAVLVLTPAALVCAHPRVLTWLLRRLMVLVRRPTLDEPITWRTLAPVVGWCVVTYLSLGVHLWLLSSSAAGPGLGGVVRSVGAISLGLSLGMLAFLAPSGLGVREAIIVAALLPSTTPGIALGMALTSRLVFTVGDLIAAGAAGLSGLKAAKSAPSHRP